MEAGLRSTGKPVGKPPIPAATAPRFYSTNNESMTVRSSRRMADKPTFLTTLDGQVSLKTK